MSALKSVLNSPFSFWILLAIPSVPLIVGWTQGAMTYGALMHASGELSARLMIVALMVTPLMMIFSNHRWPRWLLHRRRYLGVAAFSYGALHTLAYFIEIGVLSEIVSDLGKFGIWTGWAAFLILLPLVLTSNDASVHIMGTKWKTLHRAVYFAALFTVLHWIFINNSISGALVHFAPLAVLEAYRLWRRSTPAKPQPSAPAS